MKLLLINTVCGEGSTGRICSDIADEYIKNGWEVKIAYGRGSVPAHCAEYAVRIGNDFSTKRNALECRLFDNDGFGAKKETRTFIDWINTFNPDVIWLHNLHGYYINIEMLFSWIQSHKLTKIMWTLHDCWAITGHCCYFTYVKCNKWMNMCENCPQTNTYPAALRDNSKSNYTKKRDCFSNLDPQRVTIYVPSLWLKKIVTNSFLGQYHVEVKSNVVDPSIFHHVSSNVKQQYSIENKKMLLGVASQWTERKGFSYFAQLAKLLPENYVIFLVGLNDKQIETLSTNMIGIKKTADIEELVRIYSAADLFINPSREETFGMTTLEAIYCGTQVLVFKDTACEEVANKYSGLVCDDNVDSLLQKVIEFFEEKNA